MNRAVEVRTPSDGFAATFPKGDGFYPDKLKFTAQLTARAVSFQLSTTYPGIGVAARLSDEFCPKAAILPPLIIDRLPDTKNPFCGDSFPPAPGKPATTITHYALRIPHCSLPRHWCRHATDKLKFISYSTPRRLCAAKPNICRCF